MRDIIIMGSGPKWETAPQDKETWVVGKMLMLSLPPRRVDMIFSMDDVEGWLSIKRGMFTKEAYVAAVNERNVPYFSSVHHPEFTHGREYPLKEVLQKFKVPYFENTIAYMIAYALMQEGINSITLYGVSQMGAHEYVQEKGSVEFWLGIAMGMGVQVNIETPSLVLHGGSQYLYGYVETLEQMRAKGKI